MRLGPFNTTDFNGIVELLEAKNIEYSVEIDETVKDKMLAEFNEQATYSPRQMAGHLDLKIIHFEINDADFGKIKDVMENYGIVPISDGSYELGEE